MTTASNILAKIAEGYSTAVSLQAGYAVSPRVNRALFEPCEVVDIRHNLAGRCTYLLARYKDGSHLQFRWSPLLGSKYELPSEALMPYQDVNFARTTLANVTKE